jgi:hypothetical protein
VKLAATLIAGLAVLTLTLAGSALATDPQVRYPEGYRAWRHVKSMVLEKGHPLYEAVGGLHHIYANPKALEGYRTRAFPDGSVIVFDLFEAVHEDAAIAEGARKAIVVMERDALRFKATDGWGYQVFQPGTRKATLDAKAAADCASCHFSQKATGFVFSVLRD